MHLAAPLNYGGLLQRLQSRFLKGFAGGGMMLSPIAASIVTNSYKKGTAESRHRDKMGNLIARHAAVPTALALPLVLGGCSQGAPSLVLFGAFFPAWMFCAVLGIVAAIGARAVFVATDLSYVFPYQLLVCTSIGLVFALLLWLIWFGH